MRDIDVYGSIGRNWMDEDSVTAKWFAERLREAGGEDVTVHVNSGGGDVFEAQAMSEAVRAYRGRVTCSIEGLAASAASFFALTADEVVMNPSALVMVHNPLTMAYGNAGELRESAALLDKVRGTIVRQYVAKTGADEEEVGHWMEEETWFDADEALEAGLVDRLTDAPPVAARVSDRVLAGYLHAPEMPRDATEPPAAGEVGQTIPPDESDGESEVGATEDCAGAAHRVVCVKGLFLNA